MRRAAVAAAAALGLPGVPFVPASPHNYAHTHRSAAAIRILVVHTIEGSYGGAISWFRNPRARASANFVVSRDGEVTQMVPTWAVAWHAGNGYVNAHSLGIEHEGFTNVRYTVTDGTAVDAGPGEHLLIDPGHLAEVVGSETCVVLDW